jgi:hypothetical protein
MEMRLFRLTIALAALSFFGFAALSVYSFNWASDERKHEEEVSRSVSAQLARCHAPDDPGVREECQRSILPSGGAKVYLSESVEAQAKLALWQAALVPPGVLGVFFLLQWIITGRVAWLGLKRVAPRKLVDQQ